jgi:hypothetical protein
MEKAVYLEYRLNSSPTNGTQFPFFVGKIPRCKAVIAHCLVWIWEGGRILLLRSKLFKLEKGPLPLVLPPGQVPSSPALPYLS